MRSSDYERFLKKKLFTNPNVGTEVDDNKIHAMLFDFQRDITRWALKKGKAAVFADTGLGKTFIQLEWARLIPGDVKLIVAPLAVAEQTIREAKKIDITVNFAKASGDVKGGINITNYEKLDYFDPSVVDAIVLDESSILKSFSGKTKAKLIKMFSNTPYKLCCTATPCPNDFMELGNHSEFLDVLDRNEMLATFFVHDQSIKSTHQGWRLKGHAEETFWKWLTTWAMCLKSPQDLGYENDGFRLPSLRIEEIRVSSGLSAPPGCLFPVELKGIQDRIKTRKSTIKQRVEKVAEMLSETQEQSIAWVGMNEEGRYLHRLLTDSVLVEGAQPEELKKENILAFIDGKARTLISKPRICGFGMNFQNASKVFFVGIGDSFEQYYQCIRRSWRYGQKSPVEVKIVISDLEGEIVSNVLRKEQENKKLSEGMVRNMVDLERDELRGKSATMTCRAKVETAPAGEWTAYLGDCVPIMSDMEEGSVDLSVFSPPFISLYTYTASERDLGNSKTEDLFFEHFGYVVEGLLRVTRPGRNVCCHVSQIPAMLVRDGFIGMKDFRGMTISLFQSKGWIYHGEVCIDKDPQVQAIRTHSKGLLFVQLKKDSSWLRPGLADFVLVFRKPGENKIPIKPDITNDEWIQWAHPVWYGIRETNTLSATEARTEKDERHICPLQLDVIERCIRLWSNPGEVIFDPFAGIGSTGYEALRLLRRTCLIELKAEYFEVCIKNLKRAMEMRNQGSLFGEKE